MAVFHTYLDTKKESDKKRFLKFAGWFADKNNQDESEELGIRWLTDVSLPQYKNKGPWQSAFSQSRGISILLRAYQITKDEKFIKIAEKALKPFTISCEKGGVCTFSQWGPFYEEYTSTVPVLVLNGMIFALCGVYDYVRAVPDNEEAKSIFEQGIKTLENILAEYDLEFWSKYNLCSANWYPLIDPATIGYQRLHINQLNMLYQITNIKLFKDYADKFNKQDKFINHVKMYIIKFKALKKIGRL